MSLTSLNIFAPSRKILNKAKKIANYIESLKFSFRKKSNEELSNMTNLFIQRLKNGQSLDDILPEAIATAREAIYRVHNLFAYKVQVIGAIVAHDGDFAEMYTGEGKTLVIVLVAYLNALLKRGVHIVTVNEYLVQRDAQFCAQALNPLGITVGYNLAAFDFRKKKEMFKCDITYTTNSELGFDYLRDNMVHNINDKVIRELSFAIIDEADSVLIDEARVPLIISGQPKQDVSFYIEADEFANTLINEDYKIDMESHSVNLTDSGVKKAEKYYGVKNLFNIENSTLYHKIKNALTANFILQNGVEYIVQNDKIALVDQFTGRVLQDRSYNAGLHQAIQAKEKVKIDPENVTVATITYQSFFRLYGKLAGVSGTAQTEAEEFLKIYNMVVVSIPTNKPVIRKDKNDYIFTNKLSKWTHVAEEISQVNKIGQPILVGTESVEDSEELVHFLRNKGLKFQLLNAKNNAKEALIVSNAGQKGMITISTNMAGRGTDIKLGEGVAELGGLYVIGTAHHESRRIDNQLRGRSGRQGDPGITRFFVSLEDTLFKRFAIEKAKKANLKLDNEYYDSWFFTRLIKNAQKKVEALNYDMRKNLIDYDSVLSNQRELIYKQRDQILKNLTNVEIAKNMAKIISKMLAEKCVALNKHLFVEKDKISKIVNEQIFNYNIVSPDFFIEKTAAEAANIIHKIICLSIDKRVELLTLERANNLFKNIMIQALDNAWTRHLDLLVKIREGVSLRSFEQRSPLNIYVEEADNHFKEMKTLVANQCVCSINRIYIPKINDAIINELNNILPNLKIDEAAFNRLKEENKNKIIDNAFNAKPTFNIKFTSAQSPDVSDPQVDSKEILKQKIKQIQENQVKNSENNNK